MDREENLDQVLKDFREKLERMHDVRDLILFGSKAEGNEGEYSDVDLMIVSKDFAGKGHFERASEMYDFWDSEMPVDFLCYTPDEFERLKGRPTIVREALKGGRKVEV